jgi:hypothetical protein
MNRSSYVDDSNCLILLSSLPFVYKNVLVSRHLLLSVHQGMIPQCQRGENTRDIETASLCDFLFGDLRQ